MNKSLNNLTHCPSCQVALTTSKVKNNFVCLGDNTSPCPMQFQYCRDYVIRADAYASNIEISWVAYLYFNMGEEGGPDCASIYQKEDGTMRNKHIKMLYHNNILTLQDFISPASLANKIKLLLAFQ